MTIATLADRLTVRSRPVDIREPLLDLLPSMHGALSWVRDGQGLVGWGEVARVRTRGPDRFARAAQWWDSFAARLDVADEVGLPGSGAVAFTSLAFDDAPGDSVLVVPRVVLGRRDGVTWLTEIGSASVPGAVSPARRPAGLRYSSGQLPVRVWRDAVRAAVLRMDGERLDGERLDKVVLAHDLLAAADGPVDARFLLRGLARSYPSCWTFAVDGLVGATPELLLCRRGQRVGSQVLAGTSGPDDATGAANLLGSAKDRAEHRYAVDSVAAALRPHCSRLSVPAQPSVLRLHNVAHLATDIAGQLRRSDSPLLALADAVHPTAAVGGTPTRNALALIRELETMDRARYAGPVGWVDGAGDGELGIALRCAQLNGRVARLFAGCGIVAGSDPDTEVAEAAAKLVPIRDALAGVGV